MLEDRATPIMLYYQVQMLDEVLHSEMLEVGGIFPGVIFEGGQTFLRQLIRRVCLHPHFLQHLECLCLSRPLIASIALPSCNNLSLHVNYKIGQIDPDSITTCARCQ